MFTAFTWRYGEFSVCNVSPFIHSVALTFSILPILHVGIIISLIFCEYICPSWNQLPAKAGNFPFLEENCRALRCADVRERYDSFDVRARALGITFGVLSEWVENSSPCGYAEWSCACVHTASLNVMNIKPFICSSHAYITTNLMILDFRCKNTKYIMQTFE